MVFVCVSLDAGLLTYPRTVKYTCHKNCTVVTSVFWLALYSHLSKTRLIGVSLYSLFSTTREVGDAQSLAQLPAIQMNREGQQVKHVFVITYRQRVEISMTELFACNGRP